MTSVIPATLGPFGSGSHHSCLADLVTLLLETPGCCIPASTLQCTQCYHARLISVFLSFFIFAGHAAFCASCPLSHTKSDSLVLGLSLTLATQLFAEVSSFGDRVVGGSHLGSDSQGQQPGLSCSPGVSWTALDLGELSPVVQTITAILAPASKPAYSEWSRKAGFPGPASPEGGGFNPQRQELLWVANHHVVTLEVKGLHSPISTYLCSPGQQMCLQRGLRVRGGRRPHLRGGERPGADDDGV